MLSLMLGQFSLMRYPCLRLQFGGVPKGAGYRVPYVRNHSWRNGVGRNNGPYTRSTPRFPSPTLTAQRFIREQQYLASLQADREKDLLEQAAREAAMEEEKTKLEQENWITLY
ncbi:hypothetical protein HanRHA438_Chr13g0616931 [Helianthus annuus]|nr:hypothetical protein HanRHA438_Chr13g0616931 [Helianthus annuus]